MANLFRSFDFVTSLVDFYGFKGKGSATPDVLERLINQAVRRRIGRYWNRCRVFAYVQKYEFESLLFSNASCFGTVIDNIPGSTLTTLLEIRSRFATPEDINDSAETAPSKRIA